MTTGGTPGTSGAFIVGVEPVSWYNDGEIVACRGQYAAGSAGSRLKILAADNAPTNAPDGTPALATRNDISLTFGPGQGAAGSRDGSIIATNQGERTVALRGSPRATIGDSAGDTLPSSSGPVSARIDGQMDVGAHAPLGPVPTLPIAAFPPPKARTITLEWGVRPSPRQISTRRPATMVPKTSASIKRRDCGETTGQGGRSAGTKRLWSPAKKERSPSNSSREASVCWRASSRISVGERAKKGFSSSGNIGRVAGAGRRIQTEDPARNMQNRLQESDEPQSVLPT